jgi:hypothetical protein
MRQLPAFEQQHALTEAALAECKGDGGAKDTTADDQNVAFYA